MRRFSLRLAQSLVLLPILLTAGGLAAQEPDQPMPAPQPPASTTVEQVPLNPPAALSIDDMLGQLKRERDPQAARVIANSTMAAWSVSNSPTVDLLMQWSAKAAQEKRNAAALDFIDQAIALRPDFVGGWNQRATLHFTMGDYRKSVSDIERVLRLEPRHFGALAGLAGILTERGSKEAAMQAWERYLDIYPSDREAQEIVSKLSEELAGQKT
ncbi:MAG: tetratricopeptide repeat protein [Rhizobium sp.]|nr:tetratricopeptide repeat protein [Rhizobium sp.]